MKAPSNRAPKKNQSPSTRKHNAEWYIQWTAPRSKDVIEKTSVTQTEKSAVRDNDTHTLAVIVEQSSNTEIVTGTSTSSQDYVESRMAEYDGCHTVNQSVQPIQSMLPD